MAQPAVPDSADWQRRWTIDAGGVTLQPCRDLPASPASRSKLPGNTPRHENSACAAGDSSPKLQSSVLRQSAHQLVLENRVTGLRSCAVSGEPAPGLLLPGGGLAGQGRAPAGAQAVDDD